MTNVTYFSSLLLGISTCGSGFGTIVFAPVVTALEGALGWQWCNRIVASFCLAVSNFQRPLHSLQVLFQCTFLGATMKPVPRNCNGDVSRVHVSKCFSKAYPCVHVFQSLTKAYQSGRAFTNIPIGRPGRGVGFTDALLNSNNVLTPG